MNAPDADRIARRYPPPRTPRWAWVPAALAVVLVGGVWLVWSALYGANPPVSARIASFNVTSDSTVDAVVTVQRPDPRLAVTCTLIAQAVSYETVGQVPLAVPAGAQELTTVKVTIKTFKRATSVSVERCIPAP